MLTRWTCSKFSHRIPCFSLPNNTVGKNLRTFLKVSSVWSTYISFEKRLRIRLTSYKCSYEIYFSCKIIMRRYIIRNYFMWIKGTICPIIGATLRLPFSNILTLKAPCNFHKTSRFGLASLSTLIESWNDRELNSSNVGKPTMHLNYNQQSSSTIQINFGFFEKSAQMEKP